MKYLQKNYSTVQNLIQVLFSFVLKFKLNSANRSILNIWISLSMQVNLPLEGKQELLVAVVRVK